MQDLGIHAAAYERHPVELGHGFLGILMFHAVTRDGSDFAPGFADKLFAIDTEKAARSRVGKNAPQLLAIGVFTIRHAQPDDAVDRMVDQSAQQRFIGPYFGLRFFDIADVVEYEHLATGALGSLNGRDLQVEHAARVRIDALRFAGVQCGGSSNAAVSDMSSRCSAP